MNRIRVLIADDHILVREGLRLLLEAQGDLVVVGEAGDGVEAVELARQLQPDIVLLDIAMPRLNGLEAVRLLREEASGCRIIVLSMYEREAYVRRVLQDGAHGYVVKGEAGSSMLAAIRAAAGGYYYFGGKAHARVDKRWLQACNEGATDNGFHALSDREKQVFSLLIEGNSSQQIGQALGVSQKTLEKHRASIYRKLGVSSPVEMMKFAIRRGIVDPGLWKGP